MTESSEGGKITSFPAPRIIKPDEISEKINSLPEEKRRKLGLIIDNTLSGGFDLMQVEQGLQEIQHEAGDTGDPHEVNVFYTNSLLTQAAETIYEDQHVDPKIVAKVAANITGYIRDAQSKTAVSGAANKASIYTKVGDDLRIVARNYVANRNMGS